MSRDWLKLAGLVLGLALAGGPVLAQSLQDSLIAQLRTQGFVEFQVSQTLLGRLRIVAIGPDYRREIVINPSSGEILRDYITTLGGDTVVPILVSPAGSSDDDDVRVDDDDRDDGEDDHDDDGDDGEDDRDDVDDDRDDGEDDRDDDSDDRDD